MTQTSDHGSPDFRLVELECRNHHKGTPILNEIGNPSAIGAYCSECRLWIKWVPRSTVWLSLLEWQKTVARPTMPATGRINPPPADPNAPAPLGVRELPEFADKTQADFVKSLAGLAWFCNAQAIAMGFLDKERSLGDMLTLINTEMSELFEAFRHGTSDDPSEHIPEFTNKEEEWADIGVRWFCHAVEDGVSPLRLGQAFVAKLAFNRTRGYRHGGKQV
jgi:hypothetical protein